METVTRLAWGVLALIHLSSAAVLFAPALTDKLYGISPAGEAGVLVVHRGRCSSASWRPAGLRCCSRRRAGP